MKLRRFLAFAIVALFVMGSTSYAANYPKRPVKIVVPFAAGGSADLSVRTLLKFVNLGQPCIIVNMPGGGSSIGTMEVFNGRADGYTLLSNTPAGMVISELKNQLPAELTKKMIPLCVMGIDNPCCIVRSDAPYKTAEEFFKYAKEHPGEIRVGAPGMSTQYVNSLIVMDAVGIDLHYVSFDSGTKSRAALLGGHVECLIGSISEYRSLIAAGELNPLFVFSSERSPFMPNVPTLKELGYDVPSCPGLRAVWAPAGTPKDIVDILEAALMDGVQNPEFKRVYLEEMGIEPVAWNSADTRKWVEDNTVYYKKLLDKYSENK